ncbi:hypothetical protein NX059_005625 [Plenodomus lindquistii]|nr:hypothetical protein NX059_005625 [Plenodomus lindquistii]
MDATNGDFLSLLNATDIDLSDLMNSTASPQFMDPCMGPELNRTFALCGITDSFWGYRPSYSANLAFAILFAISMIAFLAQGFLSKRWWGFTFAMVFGCALELAGYIGRARAYEHLWSEDYFLIQIVCLTVAPAFLAAGIYLCLARIVAAFGDENSRIKPRSYPLIFIVCDVISLVLQATGGGMASVATHNDEKPDTGNHIMLAGLAFQVFTLCLFIGLALDFAFRTYRRISKFGASSTLDESHAELRASWVFKGFLIALTISTLCIFTRCVYRVAELSEGWSGHLMLTQKYFVGLEGAVIIAAVLILNLFHPGLCMKEAGQANALSGASRTWYGTKTSSVGSSHGSHMELKDRGSA